MLEWHNRDAMARLEMAVNKEKCTRIFLNTYKAF